MPDEGSSQTIPWGHVQGVITIIQLHQANVMEMQAVGAYIHFISKHVLGKHRGLCLRKKEKKQFLVSVSLRILFC